MYEKQGLKGLTEKVFGKEVAKKSIQKHTKDTPIIAKLTEYNNDKRFGFLSSVKHNKIFFHQSNLPKDIEEKCLNQNALFEIQIKKEEKGYKVTNMKYLFDRLPNDTHKNLVNITIDNFALKLNKAARFENDKFILYKKSGYDVTKGSQELFKKVISNTKQVAKSYSNLGYEIKKIEKKETDWRLIVGLGNESVYETSMMLHHTYGIPYIPGSAVKGITRSYVITVLLGDGFPSEKFKDIEKLIELDKKTFNERYNTDESIKKQLGERSKENSHPQRLDISLKTFNDIRSIFGNGDQQGKVIFFDAFPTEAPKLQPDIMNPHYGDYYSSKKDKNGNPIPPADYLSPNPIFFLTVNATFDFYLVIKQKDNKDGLLNKAEEWLNQALTKHGIGAKTAVGYGYFT